MDTTSVGRILFFLSHHKRASPALSNPNVELQCTLPLEAVDRYSGSTWNQLLRLWTEVTRTGNQVFDWRREVEEFADGDFHHREGKERAVVVISSAGGVYKGEGSDAVQDYLNPYLR